MVVGRSVRTMRGTSMHRLVKWCHSRHHHRGVGRVGGSTRSMHELSWVTRRG